MNNHTALVLLNFFNNNTYPLQWKNKKEYCSEYLKETPIPTILVGHKEEELKTSLHIEDTHPLTSLIQLRKQLENNNITKIIVPISSLEYPTLRFLFNKVFGNKTEILLTPVSSEFKNYIYKEMATEQAERMLPLIPLLDKIPDGNLTKMETHLKKNKLPEKIWW